MIYDLPPLPEKEQIDKHLPTGIVVRGYTAEQMQAYARAAIERKSVPAGWKLVPIEPSDEWIARLESQQTGALEAVDADAIRQCIVELLAAAPQPQPVQQEVVAWLVTGPSEKRSFDMQSFAESWCKGLNKGFGEDVYKISNLVVQSSEPHEKCSDERMCAACYSGQGKCKTQPVQQEPVAAQQRFRHPQKTMPDWSPWQPCKVVDRPAWQIDSQGYEVEYRDLYTPPQEAQPLREEPSPISVLLAVEESIKNGECPWQIEQAFEEYESQRQATITKGTT